MKGKILLWTLMMMHSKQLLISGTEVVRYYTIRMKFAYKSSSVIEDGKKKSEARDNISGIKKGVMGRDWMCSSWRMSV